MLQARPISRTRTTPSPMSNPPPSPSVGYKENSGRLRRRRRCVGFAAPLFLAFAAGGAIYRSRQKTPRAFVADPSPHREASERRRRKEAAARAPADAFGDLGPPPVTEADALDYVARGILNLVEIHGTPAGYASGRGRVRGTFCPLAFEKHSADPSRLPMFRDLVAQSPLCRDSRWKRTLDVRVAALHLESFPESPESASMYPPAGFVFHESRCGSTLAANSLAAAGPHVRVYSESAPPIAVLRECSKWDSCHRDDAVALFRDVVRLMSRPRPGAGDSPAPRLFFKIQSIGTHSLPLVTAAFPAVPWIFVYRDPTHVMMSHLARGKASNALCARTRNRAGSFPQIGEVLREAGAAAGGLSATEYCAVHLGAICRSAVEEHKRGEGQGGSRGRFVNYVGLVKSLVEEVFPNHFRLELTEEMKENVWKVSGMYSKGRDSGRAGEFKDDSKKKEEQASEEVKAAAKKFMMPLYQTMEGFP